jgi:hypothetical protein
VLCNGAPRGWVYIKQPQLTNNVVRKPLPKPVSIKIHCEFKEKSFKVSDFWENADARGVPQQDLCISIFYNGEFVDSKVYKYSGMRSSTGLGKQPNVAGRRVGTRSEVPFVLMPLKGLDKLPSNGAGPNLEERWRKIRASFLVEVDKWGRSPMSEHMRSAMGEYMEDLANMEMPIDMIKSRPDGGRNIGIIDVSRYFT